MSRHRTGLETLENRRLLTVTASFSLGALSIALDDADNVAVTASGGNVLINGLDPLEGVTLANAVTSISLTATGDFANTIDLTSISQGDFPALITVMLDAGDGSDVYKIDQSGLHTLAAATVADTGATGSDGLILNTTAAGPETIGVSAVAVSRSTGATVGYSGIEALQVDGSAASDAITLANTAAGTATTINAGAGSDTFSTVDLTWIGAAGLTINAGSNGEAITLNSSSAGTFAISNTAVQRTGNGAVNYSGFAFLTVIGTAGSDTFNITSTADSTSTSIISLGGADVFAGVDLSMIGLAGLIINSGGNGEDLPLLVGTAGTVDVISNSVKRSGNGSLGYFGFSSLHLNGTAGIDTFHILSTAAGVATSIDAGAGLDIFAAVDLQFIATPGLSIDGGGNGESLAINAGSTATPIGVSATSVLQGASQVGYLNFASLVVNGTVGVNTFNVSSTAAGTATVINAGGGMDVFNPIDLTTIGAAGLTINAGGDGESLTLNTSVAGTVSVSSNGVQRSGNGAVNYSGLATLLINGTASADTFNIASTATPAATTINAGGGLDLFGDVDLSSVGAAGLSIDSGANGESLLLKVTSAGTVGVSATAVQRAGNGAVNYLGVATLQIDGTSGVDTFDITSTANPTATTINAGGGLDLLGAIDLTTIGAAGLIINAGGQGESLTLNTSTSGVVGVSSAAVVRTGNGAVNYSGLASLLVNGTTGADTFSVASTAANTATTIMAASGLDVLAAIGLDTIGAAGLTINAGGDGESLTLDTGTNGTVAVSATTVQRTGNGPLNYGGLGSLLINGTNGADTFNVVSTAASTATTIAAAGGLDIFGAIDLTTISAAGLTINAGGDGESLTLNTASTGTVSVSSTVVQRSGNGPVNYSWLATLLVNGTAGSDTFNVASTAAGTATTLATGDGVDNFAAIDLTTIGAAGLTINAGGDGESLTLNTAIAGTVSISSTAVQRAGNGSVNYSGLASLLIHGTSGVDTFNVTSTAAGAATTILAASGLDVFGTIALTTIGAAGLTIDTGGDGEALTLNTTTLGTVSMSASTVQRTGNGSVNYNGLATLLVNGTTGADTFDVAATAPSTATTINAAGGLDVFGDIDLTTIGAAGLTVNTGGDGEALTLKATTAGLVSVSSTIVQRAGNGPINYNGLAALQIDGTSAADTFNVASTANGTTTTINALGGLDILGPIDLTTIGTAGVYINAGGDGEAHTLNTTATGTVAVWNTVVQRAGNGPINYSGLATLLLNGTAGGDTFDVASTAAGTATSILAGGGVDIFGAIDLSTISAAGLTIDAGNNGESLTLNTGVAGSVALSSTAVQRSGNGPVNYNGLAALNISGTSAADTFNVASTASATATTIMAQDGIDLFGAIDLTTIGAAGLTIDAGGNGESLVLNVTSAGTIDVSDTTVQRSGNGQITYGGLANLSINGTAGADTFNVASTAASTATTIQAGGGLDVFADIALTTIGTAGLTINAGSDSESLTLNTAAAGTVNLSSTTAQRTGNGPVTYSGFAALNVNGTSSTDTFHVASTAAATATIIKSLGGTDIFSDIDLTSIGAAGLSIDAGGDGESLTLNTAATGTVNLSATTVQRSGNGPVNYAGLATLIVSGTSGADTFVVASTAANTATAINAGNGVDSFAAIDLTTIGAAGLSINAGGDGESLTLNTTTTGTVNLSSTTVQRASNGTLAYSGLASLDLNGTAGGDTFNVASTRAATATTIHAGAGTDVFANISLTTIGAAGLTIDAGGDGEMLTLNTTLTGTVEIANYFVQRIGNGQLNYSGLAALIVNGTAGADTFDVISTAAATSTTVNALGGVDIFDDIDLTTIGIAGLTLNAGGNGELLTLNTTSTGAVDLSATSVERNGNGPVNYAGLATLIVNGTTGADTFNVASTSASTATTINSSDGLDTFAAIDLTTVGIAGLAINAGGDGESLTFNTAATGTVNLTSSKVQRVGNGPVDYAGLATLIINGTAGADVFNVASTHAATATTINALGGLDVFADLALTSIGTAGLTIHAGGDGESLTLDATTAGTVTITDFSIQRSGNGPVNYTGLASLNVNGTAGVDNFNILSTIATTLYEINAGASNDVVTLGNAGSLAGILGALAIHGNGHDATPTSTLTAGSTSNTLPVGDTLHFDDSAWGADANYTFTSNTFTRTGTALVTFDTIESFIIDAGALDDTIDILSTLASISLTVNGNSRSDLITLHTNGAGSNVLIDGGPSGDTISVQAVAAGSVVVVQGGSGDDAVNVSSNAAANTGTLNDIAGALAITTGSGNDKLIFSDYGQHSVHNSNVVVRNNRINNFAGAAKDVDLYYDFADSLELTLIGSKAWSDKFMVNLPSKPGLTMQFDGSGGTKDCVKIQGTSGDDTVQVGSFNSTRPFRLQGIECLQMFGGKGDDLLDNHTSVSSLIDGGDGNDTLRGGSKVDVIFGGDGVDNISGNNGGDYLFGDHEFNNRHPRVKQAVDNDVLTGGTGVDTIVAVKIDIVSAGGNVGDTIIGSSRGLTSVDWLRARFLTSSGKNVQNAIDAALKQPCTK